MERRNACACAVCGRALKSEESLKVGMGPVCAAKSGARASGGELWEEQPVLEGVGTLEEVGLVCRRLPDGRMATNVPHLIRHHSPSGFDVGYGGSGPAELALNVLHHLLPPREVADLGYSKIMEGRVIDRVGVSPDAERLHQDFKWKFIATMERDGGRIPIEEINSWLAQQLMKEAA